MNTYLLSFKFFQSFWKLYPLPQLLFDIGPLVTLIHMNKTCWSIGAKRIKDLNLRAKPIKLLQENIAEVSLWHRIWR